MNISLIARANWELQKKCEVTDNKDNWTMSTSLLVVCHIDYYDTDI